MTRQVTKRLPHLMATAIAGLAVLVLAAREYAVKYEKPHTWESFRGEWVGYDDSGRYFLLLVLDQSQQGTCVVSFCRDLIQTYVVSVLRWERSGEIRMKLTPTRKENPCGPVEMIGGYSFDYAGFRVASTGSVLSASVRLVRLDDLERDVNTAKAQLKTKVRTRNRSGL